MGSTMMDLIMIKMNILQMKDLILLTDIKLSNGLAKEVLAKSTDVLTTSYKRP